MKRLTLSDYLLKHAFGKKNAKTRHQLIWYVDKKDRSMRRAIENCRKSGVPIMYNGKKGGGYFIPKDMSETIETMQGYANRAKNLSITANCMKKGLRKMFPNVRQMKFTMD